MSPARKPDATHPTSHDHGRQARKPMGQATQSQSSGSLAPKPRKRGSYRVYLSDNKSDFVGKIFVSEADFNSIKKQWKRLRRHDPRTRVRTIAKREGMTEQFVHYVIQTAGLDNEDRINKLRASMVRALAEDDRAAAELWKRTA